MSTLGATTESCWRCAFVCTTDQPESCPQCQTPWTPAFGPQTATGEPLVEVISTGAGRLWLARLLDLVVPLALLTAAVNVVVGDAAAVAIGGALLAGALLTAGGWLHLLVRTGRTPGRMLLGLRTVDRDTGTPLGWGRLVRRIIGGVSPLGLITADLRNGRDPIRADLSNDNRTEATVHHSAPPLPTAGVPAVARPVSAQTTVLLATENGRSWELRRPALVGRKPFDPRRPNADLIALPDLSRTLSRTHLLMERSDTTVWATDLQSTSGTELLAPDGSRTRLEAGGRSAVPIGSIIVCGTQRIRVLAHG